MVQAFTFRGATEMQTLEKLSDRFWYQTPVSETDRPILGAVVGDDMTLMIDAGNSEAHAHYFLQELAKHKVPSPSMVAITHWHWDHIFGLSALKIPSIASSQTKCRMEEMVPYSWSDAELDKRVEEGIEIEFCSKAIKKEFPDHREIKIKLPAVTFDEKLEIDLGGVSCILQHVGGDHASDSIVVYVKEERILFLADCIYPCIYASKRNYTVRNTLKMLDILDAFDAETYILSHWKPITREEYLEEADLLRTLATLTEKHKGNEEAIREAYKEVGRDINEDEILETIQYFVNGFED
jgi:glyoxylase-like metal-dependent hydrolase (beta-lactamase superfamily II)